MIIIWPTTKLPNFQVLPFVSVLNVTLDALAAFVPIKSLKMLLNFAFIQYIVDYLSFNYYSKYNLFHHYMILSLQIFCVKKYHKLYLASRQCVAICLYPRVSNSVLISTSSELYIFDCLQLNFSTSGAPTIELGSKLKQLNWNKYVVSIQINKLPAGTSAYI